MASKKISAAILVIVTMLMARAWCYTRAIVNDFGGEWEAEYCDVPMCKSTPIMSTRPTLCISPPPIRSPCKDWVKLDLVHILVLDQRTAGQTGFLLINWI